jgi:hypothetical protein
VKEEKSNSVNPKEGPQKTSILGLGSLPSVLTQETN